jgi:hypothetical protein
MTAASRIAILALLVAVAPASAKEKVHAGGMTVNGQTVKDADCQVESGGLSVVVRWIATLAKQKKAADACAPDGAAYRVKWEWKDGKATRVAVVASSQPGGNGCIEKVMRLAEGRSDGECEATVLVGDAGGAAKAAAALGGGGAK